MFHELLQKVELGKSLSVDEMYAAMTSTMQGNVPASELAAFLTALHNKGVAVEELAGAAKAMREHMTPIHHNHKVLIDTCGPGGHSSGTFNISTAAALVTAAAGVPVAKHGNRSITSKTGSADALSALGVNILAPVSVVERCLNELGICFCFAPSLHPAMKHVAPVRKSLPFRTIFNLLGPLCNPAAAPFQLMGIGRPEMQKLLPPAMSLLGTTRTIFAYGEDGVGEVSLSGDTQVTEVTPMGVREFKWHPQDFGLTAQNKAELLVETPTESAAKISAVLNGEAGAARDIVILNAAAALWTTGKNDSLTQCAANAANAIDSGAARKLLKELVALSNTTT